MAAISLPAASAAEPTAGRADFFRYHGVWAPGVRLFRRIGFVAKAWLIAVMFALPIVVLAWNYYGDKADAIAFSAKERDGVLYARAVMPVLELLQRRRLHAVRGEPVPAELTAALQERRGRLAEAERGWTRIAGCAATADLRRSIAAR